MFKDQVQKDGSTSISHGGGPVEFLCAVAGEQQRAHPIRIVPQGDKKFSVTVNDGLPLEVEVLRFDGIITDGLPSGRICFSINNVRRDLIIAPGVSDGLGILLNGFYTEICVSHGGSIARRSIKLAAERVEKVGEHLTAPMPAIVAEVLVIPGERIVSGQAILRLEAMKVLFTLTASRDCVVEDVHADVRQSVAAGQVLITFRSERGSLTDL